MCYWESFDCPCGSRELLRKIRCDANPRCTNDQLQPGVVVPRDDVLMLCPGCKPSEQAWQAELQQTLSRTNWVPLRDIREANGKEVLTYFAKYGSVDMIDDKFVCGMSYRTRPEPGARDGTQVKRIFTGIGTP